MRVLFIAFVLCALPSIANAQLNTGMPPNYGTRVVTPNFMPDPMIVNVTSGGSISVSSAGLGAGCTGYVTASPDFNVRLTGYTNFLRFYVEGSGQDTTLVVNGPNGAWSCNDDTFGQDPSVDFNGAQPGVYNVWVGSYRTGVRAATRLNVTERMNAQPGFVDTGVQYPQQQQYVPQQPQYAPPPQPVGYINPSLNPNFGTRYLAPGFTPDPSTVRVTSGGSLAVASMNLGAGCTGFVSAAPDFGLTLGGFTRFLRMYVDAGSRDTTLVVRLPDGRFMCNDDSFGGTNPSVDLASAQPGNYAVWVGAYRAGNRSQGTLGFTELSNVGPGTGHAGVSQPPVQQFVPQQVQQPYARPQVPVAPPPTGALNPFMRATFGSATISPNFMPDPVSYPVSPGGGAINAAGIGLPTGCGGWVTQNPDFVLALTGYDNFLRVFMTASDGSDTTMIVRTPNGAWLCNDDDEGRDPAVRLQGAQPGQYQIWIGQFSYQNGRRNSGTLSFTELQ